MKKTIIVIMVLVAACNHPIRVTTIPDDRAATSGTLGSAKMQNEVRKPVDTTIRKTDTLKIIRDTL